jgi:predicted membrane channel-forming protein YqfA (hemolysin III family)
MKRITEKRWFGPKHVGWGPAPRSGEGWVVTVVWLASILGTLYYLHTIGSLNIVNIVIVIVVAAVILLSIAALTYGSDKEE